MKKDLLRLDDQLCVALYSATRAMTGAYQPVLERLGLTYPQYVVLLALWDEDGARVSRLGERLYLDSGTLTPLLKRLEARGLVERRRSTEDERVVEIFLTAEGKRLRRRAEDCVPAEVFCKTNLTLERAAKLRETLKELTRTLHAARD